MGPPLVSVIITTKNDERHIENCLLSVAEQTYPQTETIIIDNYSTDQTCKIASKYTDKIFKKGPERSAQRNFGIIHKASGKYVMFLDSDMIAGPKTIETAVSFMGKGDWLALHIPEFILGRSFFCQVRHFERSFYDGTVIDGSRFFLKTTFIKIQGFDETMSGPEDWDLDKKIKKLGNIALLPRVTEHNDKFFWKLTDLIFKKGFNPSNHSSIIFHNESDFSLKNYLSKKSYYSLSFDNYARKWGKDDPDIQKQLGIKYRFWGVFIEDGKWKRFAKSPLLLLGVYFLRLMVGIRFLARTSN
jgi:glycosyltransferase involved in cell wall biosynthesis